MMVKSMVVVVVGMMMIMISMHVSAGSIQCPSLSADGEFVAANTEGVVSAPESVVCPGVLSIDASSGVDTIVQASGFNVTAGLQGLSSGSTLSAVYRSGSSSDWLSAYAMELPSTEANVRQFMIACHPSQCNNPKFKLTVASASSPVYFTSLVDVMAENREKMERLMAKMSTKISTEAATAASSCGNWRVYTLQGGNFQSLDPNPAITNQYEQAVLSGIQDSVVVPSNHSTVTAAYVRDGNTGGMFGVGFYMFLDTTAGRTGTWNFQWSLVTCNSWFLAQAGVWAYSFSPSGNYQLVTLMGPTPGGCESSYPITAGSLPITEGQRMGFVVAASNFDSSQLIIDTLTINTDLDKDGIDDFCPACCTLQTSTQTCANSASTTTSASKCACIKWSSQAGLPCTKNCNQ